MTCFSELREKLAQPFDNVRFKPGATRNARGGGKECKPLGYIDAGQVIERLNEVCPDAWSDHYDLVRPGVVRCVLTICGIPREGVGLGGSDDAEPEKSAESDALKRAAVKFGIGLYLRQWDLPYTRMEPVGDKFFLPFDYEPPEHIPLKGRRRPTPPRRGEAPEAKVEGPKPEPEQAARLATSNQIERIKKELERREVAAGQLEDYLARCRVASLEQLPFKRASSLIDELGKLPLKTKENAHVP